MGALVARAPGPEGVKDMEIVCIYNGMKTWMCTDCSMIYMYKEDAVDCVCCEEDETGCTGCGSCI